MHQNYYFLKQLAPALHQQLAGKTFIEAFSQEKDEIILVFDASVNDQNLVDPFFIKATLRSNFACLSFPDSFDRARRNSVNLFIDFQNQKVDFVQVYLNERAIQIRFEDGKKLVFKLFGNRSNLIALNEEGIATQLFNNKLPADKSITSESLNRQIDQSYEAFVQNKERFEALFPTFGKLVNAYLVEKIRDLNNASEKWGIIQQTLIKLDTPPYYLTKIELVPALSLLPVGEIITEYNDPIEALNGFYLAYIRLSGIDKEKAEIIRMLRKRLTQTDHYLENTFKKLVELEEATKNDEIGNIIMANLHAIPERTEKIELFDFYRDQPIVVKLKKDLTAQKNAEGYYRKSKNEKIELGRLNDSLAAREIERQNLAKHLTAIESIESLRELRSYIKTNGLDHTKAVATATDLFKKVEFMGYTILIGRNAKNNDVLTKQFATKDDLWLHAKDVTGSHVVIKNQPGRNFPALVIERAAELAAFYSKRKNDSLCPVIYTPKKFVRKPKGLPEGAVVIDKENVLMVAAKGE
ncbi:NFACT RNA binding domain-containing protein [Dyadobacter chenwenxiniae]|uniref:NFACT RNA binding domain-containing protein n=1 Tax=Dyadobacter chenwenxiniae TaxID=2906456 RepID=A0A9X1PK62_9BACT|nr:NFACT RNA binding domain-containing protein [Dyadobacter chenwenxiniae]MCF0062281.1 NFACT RNA binding domain-containing protein [Dyadobacter chenwenxiniae]UON83963.1 NFACT RNA binding domain-containing protein [Dyadobacter chenwenxiniae]